MKTLKFTPELSELIKVGTKTTTWRLFDDKNLQNGDKIELLNRGNSEKISDAVITDLKEKKLGEVIKEDYIGHESYENQEEMLNTYKKYYGDKVTLDTIVKIIHFKLL